MWLGQEPQEGILVKEEVPPGLCLSPAGALKLGGRGLGLSYGRSGSELDPLIAGLDVGQ